MLCNNISDKETLCWEFRLTPNITMKETFFTQIHNSQMRRTVWNDMYKEANRDEDDESNRPGGAVLTREVGIPTGGHASRLSQRLCSAPPKFGLCLSLVSALCLKSTLFSCLCLCLCLCFCFCFCFCLLQQPVNFLWASRVAEGASNVSASSC